MVQLLGTSVSGSDPVVAEEVSMAACSIPKSSRPLSPRPCGQSLCWWRPRKADTGHSSANPKGGVLTVVLRWEAILKPKMPNSI